MKKFTLLLTSLLLTGVSFAGSLSFDETFEGLSLGNLDGQNGWAVAGSGSGVVQNSDAQSGSQALSVTEATVSRTFVGGATNTTLTFWAKPTLSEAPPADISPDASAVFYVNTNNLLVAYDGTTSTEIAGAAVSSGWNKFEVSCDYFSKVWNLSLNDTPVVTDFSFHGSPDSFTEIELTEPSATPLVFDTLDVSGDTPPPSPVYVAGTTAGMENIAHDGTTTTLSTTSFNAGLGNYVVVGVTVKTAYDGDSTEASVTYAGSDLPLIASTRVVDGSIWRVYTYVFGGRATTASGVVELKTSYTTTDPGYTSLDSDASTICATSWSDAGGFGAVSTGIADNGDPRELVDSITTLYTRSAIISSWGMGNTSPNTFIAANGTVHLEVEGGSKSKAVLSSMPTTTSGPNSPQLNWTASANRAVGISVELIPTQDGPANLQYDSMAQDQIKPDEPQDIQIVIRNKGFEASNVVSTLTSTDSRFTVNTPASITNATLAASGQETITFSVTASNSVPVGTAGDVFRLALSGYGSDGSFTSSTANISVEILSTVFSAIDKTDFAAALAGTDTTTLTVSNTAAWALSYSLSDTTSGWLTYPTGTLNLPANSSTGITVTANAGALAQGQYSGTLSVAYSNNSSLPNPTNFPVVFDIGPKVSFTGETVKEIGGVNDFPGIYEPGEILSITIANINDGAITVNNVTNSLSANSGSFSISPLTPAVYPSLTVGQTAATLYQVDISPSASHGTHTFDVQNSTADGAWSDSFTLDVYSVSEPSVSPSRLILVVPENEQTTGFITMTNTGNAGTGFSITDNASWNTHYTVSTNLGALFGRPSSSFNFQGNQSAPVSFGFNFNFYGQTYTTFSVSRYGAISLDGTVIVPNTGGNLPSGSGAVLAPFWGAARLDPAMMRYDKRSGHVVISWNKGLDDQFEAWLFENGTIEYRYDRDGDWTGSAAVGVQNDNFSQEAEAVKNKTIRFSPFVESSWVTYSPKNGTLGAGSGQVVTFSADGEGQPFGTVFTNTVSWPGHPSTQVVVYALLENPDLAVGQPGVDDIMPGETGTVQVVVVNSGSSALNVTTMLNPTDPRFTVQTGDLTTSVLSGTSVTHTFTVTAKAGTPQGRMSAFEATAAVLDANTFTGSQSPISVNVLPDGSSVLPILPTLVPDVSVILPGDQIGLQITSTNNGLVNVSNVTASLSEYSHYFTIVSSSNTTFSLDMGEATNTLYTIGVDPSTPEDVYWFLAKNTASGSVWSNGFWVRVTDRALPFVSDTLTLTVTEGKTATEAMVLTNGGSQATTYSVSTAWGLYAEETTIDPLLPPLESSFMNWDGTRTAELPIGFNFGFYGRVYTDFSVSQYGALSLDGMDIGPNTTGTLPSGTNTVIASFWGNTLISQSDIRYRKASGYLAVSWGHGTDNEVQLRLNDDGTIEYRYHQNGTWDSGSIAGIQDATFSREITPLGDRTITLTEQEQSDWISYTPQSGNLPAQTGQDILITADAKDQTAGTTYNYFHTVTWGDGTSSEVAVTVDVVAKTAGLLLTPNPIIFIGPPGRIQQTEAVLSNTGESVLSYRVNETTPDKYEYLVETNVSFIWQRSSWPTDADFNGGTATDWLPIGFDFPFYGSVYTQFMIHVNGSISLQSALAAQGEIRPFESAVPLTLDSGSSIHFIQRDDGQIIVTWDSLYQNDDAPNQTFQVVFRSDGKIRFQYDSLDNPYGVWPYATVELEGPYATTATNLTSVDPEQVILFTPYNRSVISVSPMTGTLPVGGAHTLTIRGDARSLGSGTDTASVIETFNITSEAADRPFVVGFVVTNASATKFPRMFADNDGDGVSNGDEWMAGTDENDAKSIFELDVVQNPDGSRSLFWPEAIDGLPHTYAVWFTTDLTAGWGDEPLESSLKDETTYIDNEHADEPVIYYKVMVE